MSTITLHLAKQNFKFSAAHFLIFDDVSAERLHGHNYQVKVDVTASEDPASHNDGYFVDFNVFKKAIKAAVDTWDEMVLLPDLHKDMKFKETDKSLEVTFRDRFYVFPKNEVLRLPVTNTSVEQLAKLLSEKFMQDFRKHGVVKVLVTVEETSGQGASYISV